MIILSHLKKIKVAEETLPEYQLQTIDDNNFSLVKTNPGNKTKNTNPIIKT